MELEKLQLFDTWKLFYGVFQAHGITFTFTGDGSRKAYRPAEAGITRSARFKTIMLGKPCGKIGSDAAIKRAIAAAEQIDVPEQHLIQSSSEPYGKDK